MQNISLLVTLLAVSLSSLPGCEEKPSATTSTHVLATGTKPRLLEIRLQEDPASINEVDEFGQTPLHEAARFDRHNGSVELLTGHKADVNARDKRGRTPLHLAAMHDAHRNVELLIERGAVVEVKDENGKTPLHYAGMSGSLKTAEILLEKGAEINALDDTASTPLEDARGFNTDDERLKQQKDRLIELLQQKGGK